MGRKSHLAVDFPLLIILLLALIGLGQFLVAVPIAMDAYPGGTRSNMHSSGYSWEGNWLSDLGRSTAWSGQANGSAWIFNYSIVVLGLSLVVFFAGSTRANDEVPNVFAWVTAGSGCVSGLGLVLLGVTPFDIYHKLHLAALAVWIISMIVAACSFSMQVLFRGGLSAIVFPVASLVLIGGVVGYALSGATDNVMLMQKVCVGISLCWLLMVLWRIALTAIYIVADSRTRYQLANEQATRYLKRIENGHLMKFERHD